MILVGLLYQVNVFAQPTTWLMELNHHEFKNGELSPNTGDQIIIINQSEIAHAIYVTYPDGTVITLSEHVQLPGTSVEWVIPDIPGEYTLRCWIHPIIRATLSVSTVHP